MNRYMFDKTMTRNKRMTIWKHTLLLLMMVMGAIEVWGQAETDYSGMYYIRSESNQKNTDGDYYLCPTRGWYLYKAINNYENDTDDNDDNGMPFLTTYQCKDGTYELSKAVWIVKKHTTEDCYYIIQKRTGRYMVSNGKINGSSSARRMRVHLEEVADDNALTNLGDKALFQIIFHKKDGSTTKDHLDIIPCSSDGWNGDSEKRLVVNFKNFNILEASEDKPDGPNGTHGKGTGGIIGVYSTEANEQWALEDIPVPTPTITNDITSDIIEISCSEEDTKIYYTLDGTNPTTSSTLYTNAIPYDSNLGVVKAIAVRSVGSNTKLSSVAVLPINYTYYIVNMRNKVAITKTVKQLVGTPLSNDYNSIPADIRSSYISDEDVTFYSFDGTYNVGDNIPESVFEVADPINATPATGTNIYVRYTSTNLGNKYLHLQGARPLNLKDANGQYYKENNVGTVIIGELGEGEKITDNAFLWYISSSTSAGDPYDVLVKNSDKTKYLTPTPSLTATAYTYFITANSTGPDTDSNGEADYEDITLKSYADGTTLTVRVNEVEIPTSYHLIDKNKTDFSGPIESNSTSLDLPDSWKSPLVTKYHFWRESAFNITTTAGITKYELKKEKKNETGAVIEPAPTEIQSLTELENNEQIYVTYDVDPSFVFDTTDKDDVDGMQAYRLQFTGGESFNQENGKDAVMTKSQKAVFPYANGDACLYVYGQEQWDAQLSSGASTRTRWLWYVVSENSDPYHVYIMSYQGQASSHNYFRTYSVEYGGNTHIVTGVTTRNAAVGAEGANELPTEYMILKQRSNCKLVTVEGRHVVNSFEQYWKNNPTVLNLIDPKVTDTETYADDITLSSDQTADLPSNWHTYKAFANAAPWVGWKTDNTGTGKQYKQKSHWFQTIDMGSTGEFI